MILNGIDYDKLPLRYVFCIDVKSFFASVEAARRGLDPLTAYVVVLSNPERPGAIVLAASPRVKAEFGIKTGTRKYEIPKTDKLLIVEPSMALYIEMNRKINDIFKRYAAEEDILSYSIDESFIDITDSYRNFKHLGTPYEIALRIKEEIRSELGLEVTIGIGDNPLLAKLAMDNEAKKTKNQIAYWSYESIPETVWKIGKLTDFWGISRGYERRLNSMGIYSIYNLAHSDKKVLKKKFGIIGLQQYYHANGVDYSRISKRIEQKSKGYSKGQVLFSDYEDETAIITVIEEMVDDVCIRLRKRGKATNSIHLYLGFSDKVFGGAVSVSKRLKTPSTMTKTITEEFLKLFKKNWKGEPIRQINVSLNDIEEDSGYQMDFWQIQNEKDRELDETLDKIKDKFGKTAVFKANALTESSTFFKRARDVGGHKGMSEIE